MPKKINYKPTGGLGLSSLYEGLKNGVVSAHQFLTKHKPISKALKFAPGLSDVPYLGTIAKLGVRLGYNDNKPEIKMLNEFKKKNKKKVKK